MGNAQSTSGSPVDVIDLARGDRLALTGDDVWARALTWGEGGRWIAYSALSFVDI